MEVTRNSLATVAGPSDWFTGTVLLDPVAAPSAGSRIHASNVHFTPGARTAWHTHPNGQTIWVTEGVGHAQRRGGAIEVIRPGDRVFFEPGEEHWHGAAATRFMAHVAILEVDDEGTPRSGVTTSPTTSTRRRRLSTADPLAQRIPVSTEKTILSQWPARTRTLAGRGVRPNSRSSWSPRTSPVEARSGRHPSDPSESSSRGPGART